MGDSIYHPGEHWACGGMCSAAMEMEQDRRVVRLAMEALVGRGETDI